MADGASFVKAVKEWNPFGLNVMFALLQGDIGYQATGVFPRRLHNVVQGVYAKDATRMENMWTGVVTSDDLPHLVNPQKGYLVSTNNLIAAPANNPFGLSYGFSMNYRAERLSELLESLIANATAHPIRVWEIYDLQKDLLDVQARESLPAMLACAKEGVTALSEREKKLVEFAAG